MTNETTVTIPKTAAFGEGILYPPNLTPDLISTLKTSGIETLIIGLFHIESNGDIVLNDTTLIHYDESQQKSIYVGDPGWSAQLQELIGTESQITQMEASIGGWATGDYERIKTIYQDNGDSFNNTAVQSNFQLFKSEFPTITLIDTDVEETYDQTSFVAFCQMLIAIGFGITFCPYTETDFWTGSLNALNKSNPGAVKWWNLQCYAGGGGNDPDTWAGYITSAIPGFKTDGFILASDWSRFYNTQDQAWEGDCAPAFESLMATFKGEASVGGGFVWNIDQVEGYEAELKIHPDPAECSKTDRSLSDYIQAINNGLGN
ncbi:MAG TPA: hypothetical protein VK892_09995 [Pyrinomonadaceae bacterium]|nr:hypothetical protein [Pyrinomonadaceae bacterium]